MTSDSSPITRRRASLDGPRRPAFKKVEFMHAILYRRVYISLVCLAGLMLCFPAKTASSETGNHRKPVEIIVALGTVSREGFDPIQGWGRYGTPLFQSTLFRRDENLRIVPDLALDYRVSKDGRYWTVRIRTDAVFSDGRPVTAGDVAFTYNKAARSAGKTDLTFLDKAVVTGEYEVELHLRNAASTFIHKLVTLGIVPQHAYDRDYARRPVGSGPFKLVQWDEGQQLIIETNPLYYGRKSGIGRIVFLDMDEQTAFAAARAGKVHLIRVPQALAVQKIPGMTMHNVPSVDNRGICFPCIPDTGRRTPAGFPVGNNVTADPAIRTAINYAIDRKALVNGILEGFGSPCHTPATGLPWEEPDAVIQDNDLPRAKAILAEGGWLDSDKDGVVEKNGIRAAFTIYYPADDSIRQSLAIAVSDRMRAVGIQVDIKGGSWDNIYKVMHHNAVLFGFGSLDPLEMYNMYHSTGEWDVYNAGHYHNPMVDRHLDQAMHAVSDADAVGFWKKAQWDGKTGLTARGDAAWCWLVNLDHTYFADHRLRMGKLPVEPHEHGMNIIATILSWEWDEAAACKKDG